MLSRHSVVASGTERTDSSVAVVTAPVPRPVGVNEPRPNAGSTATPVMRMSRRTLGSPADICSTVTGIVWPTRAWTARIVWAPRAISSGAAGARPASIVR